MNMLLADQEMQMRQVPAPAPPNSLLQALEGLVYSLTLPGVRVTRSKRGDALPWDHGTIERGRKTHFEWLLPRKNAL